MSKTSHNPKPPITWWLISGVATAILALLVTSFSYISKHREHDKAVRSVLAQQLIVVGVMRLNYSALNQKVDHIVSDAMAEEIRVICRKNSAYLNGVSEVDSSQSYLITRFNSMCERLESGTVGGYLTYGALLDHAEIMSSVAKDSADTDEKKRLEQARNSKKAFALDF